MSSAVPVRPSWQGVSVDIAHDPGISRFGQTVVPKAISADCPGAVIVDSGLTAPSRPWDLGTTEWVLQGTLPSRHECTQLSHISAIKSLTSRSSAWRLFCRTRSSQRSTVSSSKGSISARSSRNVSR
jgi:hypothetical protein